MVRVTSSNGATAALEEASMTSGASATSSVAYLRMVSALPSPHRYSIRMFCPTIQPACWRPCANAVRRAWPSASFAANGVSTPMRRTRSPCCPRAAIGHAAAAPPSSVMNSRRLILNLPLQESVHRILSLPWGRRRVLQTHLNCSEWTKAIAGVSHPPIGGCQHNTTPFGGRRPDWVTSVESVPFATGPLYPQQRTLSGHPRTDAEWPIGDIRDPSFDHLVGAKQDRSRQFDLSHLGGLDFVQVHGMACHTNLPYAIAIPSSAGELIRYIQ